jgi:hypothetical protein
MINVEPILRPLIFTAIFSLMAIFVHDLFYIMMIILLFDIRARYVDYRNYKDREWSPMAGKRFMRSFCSRGVARSIWGNDAVEFFKARGYKPYHIFPDEFPMVLFKKRLWKSVFGV